MTSKPYTFYNRNFLDEHAMRMAAVVTFEFARGGNVKGTDFSRLCTELRRAIIALDPLFTDLDVVYLSSTFTTVTCMIRSHKKPFFMVELIQMLSNSLKVSPRSRLLSLRLLR